MKKWNLAVGLLAAVALASCGGGGGGGGLGGIAATVPKPALTTTVKINGQAATAQSADQYAVKPGDTVEITPSQSVSWTSSSSPVGISANALASTPSQWSAQLVNETSAPATYTVTASAGAAAANTKSLQFVVAGGDSRNGSYKAFATNGTRQTLALNFDTSTYTWTDSNNVVLTGSFAADANEAGTYVFQSARITTVANTARFHLNQDTVVGAFPFVVTQSTTETYAIQPFVASRALETQQAALDGVYNRFGIDVGPSAQSSDISQFQISGGGTTLVRCNDGNISRIELCPPASLQTWQISPGSVSGMWTMVDTASPSNTANIALARIGNQRIFLIAGKSLSDPHTTVFRIGVPESTAWPAGTGYGTATPGSWGRVQVAANNTSTRSGVATDGSAVQTFNTFYSMAPSQPNGMRLLPNTSTGATYFTMQGANIFAIVGANDPSHGTNGYLQISLMD
ncbi:hypothetical protein VAR608DRAFT_6967 [Variovorax sp. HW608]|uniref:hypothetical protein n=1 Tax=Variovorax sp. HW608 TaxID=1034889 RepID=UPI0008200982|nr:hypothetical protein [Variovorax sp. HW608]SCK61112.1 hypothetical protein VAR608DRAFT_6967 [Variovorax sp. HW608]